MADSSTFVPDYKTCTAVSPQCPISATTYGYAPNLPANAFLTAWFGVLLLLALAFGIRAKAWTYTIALGIGATLEFIGYIGRVLLHANPWSQSMFSLEIVGLVLAPSFLAAAVYLTLKHLVLHYGPEHSLIKPKLYPWLFVGCDIGSICLQAIGGGLAASGGKTDFALINAGDQVIIAGIAFQVATMIVCGVLVAVYVIRYRKARSAAGLSTEKREERSPTTLKLKFFCASIVTSYFLILIRCIYRLPEMAGGWGNPLMQNETEFMVFDGMMIALATLLLTVVHPSFFFPRMCTGGRRSRAGGEEVGSSP